MRSGTIRPTSRLAGLIAVPLITAALLPATASAVTPPACSGVAVKNYAGQTLTSTQLGPDAQLTCDDLQGAKITGGDLTDADLSYANLTDADLRGTDLTQANLTGANLSGAQLAADSMGQATLSGADLTGADLSGADLTQVTAHATSFTGADLSHAKLGQLEGQSADFTGANLGHADLGQAELQHAVLAKAKLGGTDFTQATLTGVNFTGATGVTPWGEYIALLSIAVAVALLINPIRRALTGRARPVRAIVGTVLAALAVNFFLGGMAEEMIGSFGTPLKQTCHGAYCAVGINTGIIGILVGIFGLLGSLALRRSGLRRGDSEGSGYPRGYAQGY